MAQKSHPGSCLCGAITFDVKGDMRPVVACHCGQCRKTSGHFWAATQVDDAQLHLKSDDTLRWYRSSGTAKRAFCTACGSSLFWKMDGEDKVSIGAGSLETTGLETAKHIYTSDKGDYYEIADGLPQL